ncbi:MAG TPA: penicillin-binding transpeptidase domain-containing protein [Polyangiaceae bacterium]|nr:penicillin-binding transpeptidase domain-containing protein [Polyangiaceae bacterium]
MRRAWLSLALLTLPWAVVSSNAGAASQPESLPAVPEAPPARAPKARGPSTLDASLQRSAERLLRGAKPVEGAIVALDPKTGKVLSFSAIAASGSSFEVLTQARLPAASLFKVVTTTALFENTQVSPQDQVCINGGMHGIERRHLEPAHGPGTECGRFAWALGHSKNAVFAQLATRLLTREDLLRTAERLGFNGKLPLDDGEEQAELGKLSVPYNDLEFARAAAGFQGSSLSPVGAAYLMTLIARGGEAVALRLHEPVPSEPDALGDTASDSPRPAAPISARTAQRLTRMLEVTVETGTSRGAFTAADGKRYLPGIRVAGKTGTLRPGQGEDTMTSWFAGFAPSRNPEIVVSVMLVNGRTYRRKANELARDLLRTYFHAHGHAQSVSDPFAPEPLAVSSRE